MLAGQKMGREVDVSLPGGGSLRVEVEQVHLVGPRTAEASVIKDAGDDPDVTNGARVVAAVHLGAHGGEGVVITRGEGVGLVTRPGLAVGVGQPAINPVPRRMIREAVREVMGEGVGGVEVEVSVPRGRELARYTLNPRLGITGGISILGTTGLVKPFSHEGYTATISAALSVARAAGLKEVVFTTGGRSERFARQIVRGLEDVGFVQIADYFEHALGEARRLGFWRVGMVVFFGKGIKQAMGLGCTHARAGRLRLDVVGRWLAEAGVEPRLVRMVARANTARRALELLEMEGCRWAVGKVCGRLVKEMGRRLGEGVEVWAAILDYQGRVVAWCEGKGG